VTVKTSMTDVGTGSCAKPGQIAADMLGLPIDKVRVELSDSYLPEAPGAVARSAPTAAVAVFGACMTVRGKIRQPADMAAEGAQFADDFVTAGGKWQVGAVCRSHQDGQH
jgi:xanthine dehydrogenase YagR molybdenum-binding subunit